MKRINLVSEAKGILVDIKIAIFASVGDLQLDGFDKEFEFMDVVKQEGDIDITSISLNWQSIVKLAKENDLNIFVTDLTDVYGNKIRIY